MYAKLFLNMPNCLVDSASHVNIHPQNPGKGSFHKLFVILLLSKSAAKSAHVEWLEQNQRAA